MNIFIERFQNFILKGILALSVPLCLEKLILMTPVAQHKPASVLCSIQIPGSSNPNHASCCASHRVRSNTRFLFFEFPD